MERPMSLKASKNLGDDASKPITSSMSSFKVLAFTKTIAFESGSKPFTTLDGPQGRQAIPHDLQHGEGHVPQGFQERTRYYF